MAYVLGIDVGTSFTSAATVALGESGPGEPQVLGLGLRTSAVPSVIFFGDDGRVMVGEAAERRGSSHPERLVREFKRRMGDQVPIVVGDLSVAAEDILAIMVRWVVDRAEEREGLPPEVVAVSHPASWGDYKTSLVRLALAGVGLAQVSLLPEPEAAALHYAARERLDTGSTIAVYDLGGGTFDIAILTKTTSESFALLGRPEGIEGLGGADFDEAVFAHVTESIGEAYGRLDVADPAVLVALARLRRECTEAKEALSFDSEASIPVVLPGLQTEVRLVRSEFEALIETSVRETITALDQALERAEVGVDEVAAILLIGGSSRVPLVAQLLSAEFGRPMAVDVDPKASVSLGAAYFASVTVLEAASAGLVDEPERGDIDGEPAPTVGQAHRPHFGPARAASLASSGNSAGHVVRRPIVRTAAVAALVAGAMVLAGTAAQLSTGLTSLTSDTGQSASNLDRSVHGTVVPPTGEPLPALGAVPAPEPGSGTGNGSGSHSDDSAPPSSGVHDRRADPEPAPRSNGGAASPSTRTPAPVAAAAPPASTPSTPTPVQTAGPGPTSTPDPGPTTAPTQPPVTVPPADPGPAPTDPTPTTTDPAPPDPGTPDPSAVDPGAPTAPDVSNPGPAPAPDSPGAQA
ncbi:MAG: hypothetical protein JWQ68_944 [Cryobacterium sp.]|jgi:molecular chaperone DnaK|nr:hypothetical protein [Cryobacterium sp.]